MIFKKVNNVWEAQPKALEDEPNYEQIDPFKNEIRSDSKGYIGEIETIYATSSETFDSISPNALREKTFKYIQLKAEEARIKGELKDLDTEIKSLHFAVQDVSGEDKGINTPAGNVNFKEETKISYTPEAKEKIQQLLQKYGLTATKKGKPVFENKINDSAMKNLLKENPELEKEIGYLQTKKVEIKTVITPNKDFMIDKFDPIKEFGEDREKAKSERYQIFQKVLDTAIKYEDQKLQIGEAQVFVSQLEILKNNYNKKMANDLIYNEVGETEKNPNIDEMEMN